MNSPSVCSGMPMRSRFRKTAATMPGSSFGPVSFSTIDARISACAGLFNGLSGLRRAQAACSRRCIAAWARFSTVMSLTPRL